MTNVDNSPKSNRRPTEEGTPPGRWWIEERLAVLLLRLLGVYFVACAIVSGMRAASFLWVDWRSFGGDKWLACADTVSLARAAAELIVGVYFVVGGQWAFDRILTPISRRRGSTDGRS
jgi:hypothetical protein